MLIIRVMDDDDDYGWYNGDINESDVD